MLKIPYPINEVIAPQQEIENGGRNTCRLKSR